MNIIKIIEAAIPLDEKCQLKRTNEIHRRVQLKLAIEQLLRERDKSEPYKPNLEYKEKA